MKKLLPLLVVLALVAASSLAWVLLAGKPERAPVQVGALTEAPEPPASGSGAGIANVEEVLPPEADAPPTRGRRSADEPAFDRELLLEVRGTVDLPQDLPGDELLHVLAFERGAPSLLPGATREPHEPGSRGGNLGEAEVDGLGGWSIAVPRDLEVVLVLRGRYLRSDTQLAIDMGELPHDTHFPTELGAWITGRLLPPEGQGIDEEERKELIVEWSPGTLNDFTRVGSAGRVMQEQRGAKLSPELGFEFTGVGAFEGYVRVVPQSLAAAKSARHKPRPGQHLVLDLPLTEGGTLAGIVVDDTGAPVAEAELEVSVDPIMMGQGGFEVRKGETDADGRFVLEHVAAGAVILSAEAHGHLDARSEFEFLEGESRNDLRLELALGNAIAGRLRWPDGSPARVVEVVAEFDAANLGGMGAFNAMRGPRGDATTDEDGGFRITGLGKGPFTVRASTRRDEATWNVRQDGVAPQTLDLELVLGETLAISGRVVDDRGEPVESFRVRATEKTGGMIPGLGGARESKGFEDEEGRFRLEGLSERTWLVHAEAEGHGRAEPIEVVLGQATEEVTLSVPRAASVSGVVLAPDGRPVANAEVTLKFELMQLATMAGRGETPLATTQSDGTFLLEGLTPGSSSLVATAEGFADSEGVPVELEPAQVLADVRLTLRVGGRILGEIYDKAGEPQAGAPILAQNPTNFSGQKWTTSDSNGEFVLENLVPGTWQVMTLPGRGALEDVGGSGDDAADMSRMFSEMKFQMAEVVEGEDVHVVLGGRPADPVTVRGRVLAGGVPQAGALVNFMADGVEGEGGIGAFKIATSGKDGSYLVELDRPGGYMVQVQKLVGGSGQQQSVQLHYDLPDEREQTLDLDLPVGTIAGMVYGPDGKPLGGARVSLTKEGGVSNLTFGGGQYAEIATASDGSYELIWLREGKYTVSAGGPLMGGMFGGGEDAPARSVRSGVRVGDGDRVDGIDFRLKAPGRLVGTVVDSAGKPVAEAAVFVRDEAGNLLERISMAATDSAGKFTYAGIGAGRYLVHARSRDSVSAESAAVVREGADSELQLTVAPGAVLLITLADENGEPVDCSVTVTDDDGRQVNGNWSMADLMALFQSGAFTSKEQRVGPVAAGRYTIHAETAEGLSATKRVTIRDQDERRVNLRLKE